MIALVKALLSNCTFDRGSLTATYVKAFDLFAVDAKNGDWLAALDDFRNWWLGCPPSPSGLRRHIAP
jgi:hypothetical protein